MKALSPLSFVFFCHFSRKKCCICSTWSWDCDFWRQATRAAARRPNSSSGYWGAPGAEGQECGLYCEIIVFDIDVLKFDAFCCTWLSDQALVSWKSTLIGLQPTSTLLHLPACVVLSPKIAKTMSVSPPSKLWTTLVPATKLKGLKLLGLSTHHLCVFLRTGLQCWLSKLQVWKMIRDDTSIMVVSHMSHGRKKSARSCLVPGKVSTGLGSRQLTQTWTTLNRFIYFSMLLHTSPVWAPSMSEQCSPVKRETGVTCATSRDCNAEWVQCPQCRVQTATLSCNWCSLWWVINVNWHMTFEPGASYMMRRNNAARHQCRVNKTLPQIDNKVHGQARIMLAIYVQYTSHTKKIYLKMQHHTFVIYWYIDILYI